MSRIDGPTPASGTPPVEPDFTPAQPRQAGWKDVFARSPSRGAMPHNDFDLESDPAKRDALEDYVEEARAQRQFRQTQALVRSRQGAQGGAQRATGRGRSAHGDLSGSSDENADNDDLQTRRLLQLQRGSGGQGNSQKQQSRSGAQQVRLFLPPRPAAANDLMATHPVRLALARLESDCGAAQACDAPRNHFTALIDAGLRETLLLVAQGVASGAAAEPLLEEVIRRVRALYAQHARGLLTPLGDAAGELVRAFGDWRAPESALPRMAGLFVALPGVYMWIRSGGQRTEAA